jgi:UDP-N-acetylmuramoylalanine--D-glutamate ligase
MTITSVHDVHGKKVLILGLGLHGGGVAGAYWFFCHGAEVIITDIKTRQQLAPSIARLTALCNTYRLAHPGERLSSPEYILGKHREEDVLRADCIIQNPGVPRELPMLALARERGISIHNDASILFALVSFHTPTIGVTGTRGKTTTVVLIAQMLRKKYPKTLAAGYATRQGAVSFFSLIDKALDLEKQGVIAPLVLELSSWQLELLSLHRKSPHIAVITNIYPDHLNRHSSMDEYVDAKKNIYRFQDPGVHGNGVVLNYDNSRTRALGDELSPSGRYWFSRLHEDIHQGAYVEKKGKDGPSFLMVRTGGVSTAVCASAHSVLKGPHNEENILAALTVATMMGVSPEALKEVCLSARGVQGRLEYVGTFDGRALYNDTAATSPDATSAALLTLGKRKKNIILIAGGADKGLEFEQMGADIATYCKALVMLPGSASLRIVDAVAAAGYSARLALVHTMHEAVEKAWMFSAKGDIILLSPGAASFGLFQHEFDRGDQFLEEIGRLRQ